jgi:putative CocE/NonD family hydrolase
MSHSQNNMQPSPRTCRTLLGFVVAAVLGQVAPSHADTLVASANVEMRDGVGLETFVYLPAGPGPFPTLVTRTIYGLPITPMGGEVLDSSVGDLGASDKHDDEEDDLDPAAAVARGWPLVTARGYALVIQNTRGRFGSGGIDRSWLDDGNDGYDLIEWVAAQPWSNGRIGIFGDSASGMSAALAAAARPPSLDAVFLQAAPGDPFGIDMAPKGGAKKIETLLLQGASLAFDVSSSHVRKRGITEAEARDFNDRIRSYFQKLAEGLKDPLSSPAWMAAPLGQSEPLSRLMPFWRILTDADALETYRVALDTRGKIAVPTSIVSLWQDIFVESALALQTDLATRGVPTELLVVNGTHYEIDNPRLYPAPRMLSWFDHWLKDAPPPKRPAIEVAVQGSLNEFIQRDRLADAALLPGVVYLTSEGTLSLSGAGAISAEVAFLSDPASPVPTLGGRNLLARAGTSNHASLLGRVDTAVFRMAPVAEQTLIAGPVTAELTVRSDARSFDVSARLLDLAPDGTANLVLSHLARVTATDAGETRVAVGLGHIVHRLEAGHQLALLVAGSDFTAWDRNPQTGGDIFTSSTVHPATLRIVTGGDKPSALAIPFSPSK